MTKNIIKVIFAEKKKTNIWLAKKIGRDETTILRWCTNRAQSALDTLGEIANVLNVDAKDLIVTVKFPGKNQEAI